MKKTVLITGGSRGIGKATSLEFAKHGYNIVINYVNDDISAKNLKSYIVENYDVDVMLCKCNVSNEDGVKGMVNSIIDNYVIERFMAEMPNIKVASKLNKEIIESLSKLANSEFVYKLTNILSNSNINENTTDKKTL